MQFPAIESTKHYTTVTIPDRATVRDVFECAVFNLQLFKAAYAETGVSSTSPLIIKINGRELSPDDSRKLFDIGILGFDIIEIIIQTNAESHRLQAQKDEACLAPCSSAGNVLSDNSTQCRIHKLIDKIKMLRSDPYKRCTQMSNQSSSKRSEVNSMES